MNLVIERTGSKEYIAVIPPEWDKEDENWQNLIIYLQDCFEEDGTIYLNMTHVHRLSTYAFNRLFDLTSVAAEHICRLVFMNVDDQLEEKVAMLNHQSE